MVEREGISVVNRAISFGLFAAGVLTSCADPEQAVMAPPVRQWDACAFLRAEDVADVLGVDDVSGIREARGAGDHDWLTYGDGTARLQTAMSQCSYDTGSDASKGPKLTIVARLAGVPDRSVGQTRRLLERQGYHPEEVDVDCVDGALWLDGELHAFFEGPSRGGSCENQDAGSNQDAPLYANAVFFLDSSDEEAERRKLSLKLASLAERPIREAMDYIRNFRPNDNEAGLDTHDLPAVLVPDEVGAQEYPIVAAQVVCERALECCATADLSLSAVPTDSVASCTSFPLRSVWARVGRRQPTPLRRARSSIWAPRRRLVYAHIKVAAVTPSPVGLLRPLASLQRGYRW